jgi:ABC-type antimicrobial peptide transport system permease subunit
VTDRTDVLPDGLYRCVQALTPMGHSQRESHLLDVIRTSKASLVLARSIASLLYGITPFDAAIFASVSLMLAVVALLASFIPARRAASVNPIVALRYE